jgi:hypothetical protein
MTFIMDFRFAKNRFVVEFDVACIKKKYKSSCMEMCIEKGKLVKDIQKEFNEIYPFLKIELVEKGHPGKMVVDNNMPSNAQHIDVGSKKTVAELESDFRTYFNLAIQVFRRAGNLWIETSLTHDWSLEQQNKEGELFSNIHSSLVKK